MDLTPIVVLAIFASVPLAAILGKTYTNALRLRGQASRDVLDRLEKLEAENQLLRQRLEAVEVIVTDGEWAPPSALPEESIHAGPVRQVRRER